MKVKWYETQKRCRLIVPARFTGTGKKQFILFKSKSDGEAEIRRILNRGSSSKPQITEADEAEFTLAKDEGLSPQQMLDAIRLLPTMTTLTPHADNDHKGFDPDLNPVTRELRRIARSSDAHAINQMIADFYTDPAVIALAATTVSTESTSLSSYQKDIFNTYATLANDPIFLRKLIANPECLDRSE